MTAKISPGDGPSAVTRTYDLLKWTIPQLQKFPRDQKFLLGDRIENGLLVVLELLVTANYSRKKTDQLQQANLRLEMLRFLFRLSFELKYLNQRRYELAASRLDEIGRMVGGWLRQQRTRNEATR